MAFHQFYSLVSIVFIGPFGIALATHLLKLLSIDVTELPIKFC